MILRAESRARLAPVNPAGTTRGYQEAVHSIDLLICGAGSKHSLLFQWLEKHACIELSRGAAGDICLIPISARGEELRPRGTGFQLARKHLRPNPNYSHLQTVAARDGIILILVAYQGDDLSREEEAHRGKPHSKLDITRAMLQRSLARTIVLGAALTQALLASLLPRPLCSKIWLAKDKVCDEIYQLSCT